MFELIREVHTFHSDAVNHYSQVIPHSHLSAVAFATPGVFQLPWDMENGYTHTGVSVCVCVLVFISCQFLIREALGLRTKLRRPPTSSSVASDAERRRVTRESAVS